MQDMYMVGNNVTWSNEWNTPCTPDFWDCGCDNCLSIAAGYSATVPPSSTTVLWSRLRPCEQRDRDIVGDFLVLDTGRGGRREERVVKSIVGINQCALSVVPWADLMPADIKSSSSAFARSLPKVTPYLFDPASVCTASSGELL